MGFLTKRVDEKKKKKLLVIKEVLVIMVLIYLALSHREAYLEGLEACKTYSCYFCHMNDSLSYLFNRTPMVNTSNLNLSNINNTIIDENWLEETWGTKT